MAAQALVDVAQRVCILFILFCYISDILIPVSGELGLGNLVDVFAALAGEDTCVFKCPTGHKPKADSKHEPKANGCGAYGLKFIAENPAFEDCCNKHDKCYDTCNNMKDDCDNKFKECLKDSCHMKAIKAGQDRKKLKDCNNVADIMYAGALSLGCQAFLESQRNACMCNNRKLSKKQVEKMMSGEL